MLPGFVAVLLMLMPASDCVTRGELCHPPQPYGLAMADGSETQKKCDGALQASVIHLARGQKIWCAPFPCKNVQITVKFCFYRPQVWL